MKTETSLSKPIPSNWFGDVFAASLQTTFLNKIFEIVKPESIRKIKADGTSEEEGTKNVKNIVGIKYVRKVTNRVYIDYDSEQSPKLDRESIKQIKTFLKSVGVNDVSVHFLEIEMYIDFEKVGAKPPKGYSASGLFVAKFRNESCPDRKEIKEDLKQKNIDICNTDRNQFRYRQLLLYYLIAKTQLSCAPYTKRNPMIDLALNWYKKKEIPKWGSDELGSHKTIRAIQDSIGDYWCVSLCYKKSKNNIWEFIGTK